eukprot:Gb_41357 [translate_table: standard]
MEAALMHHPNAHSLPPPKPKLQPSKAGHEVNPPKLANHDQLVSDRQLFLDTLTKFHDALGTKFVDAFQPVSIPPGLMFTFLNCGMLKLARRGSYLEAPTIAGKELDLHLLYVEVTARGGLEQKPKCLKGLTPKLHNLLYDHRETQCNKKHAGYKEIDCAPPGYKTSPS